MAFSPKEVCQKGMQIKKNGGCQDDLVRKYTSAEIDSDEFKKVKQNIVQCLTNTRRDLRDRLLAPHLEKLAPLPADATPEQAKERQTVLDKLEDEANEKIAKIVPSFRENRNTAHKQELNELFDMLEEMGEDIHVPANYVPMEPV